MKDIAVYGAGAYGQEVCCLINKINTHSSSPCWRFIGFFDDNRSLWDTENHYGKILGGKEALNHWDKPLDVVLGLANIEAILSIVSELDNHNISFPNIIDPDTSFLDRRTVSFGMGNVIGEVSRLAPNVHFGNFNIVVNDCVFGHDVVVGDCNVFYPAVRLSGGVRCGNSNLFGVRSTVLQGLTIGSHVKIAAGSFLMNDAQDGFTYRGNPARKSVM